jgi:hypothetical protein
VGNCSLYLCVVFHSFCFFSTVSGRRCILVIWYLMAAVLSKGWLESKLIVVLVVVGFLYISTYLYTYTHTLKSNKPVSP